MKKICTKCGKEKPLAEFNRLKKGKDGYNPRCKDCHNTDNRGYSKKPEYKKKKQEYIDNNRDSINKIKTKYNHSDKRKKCDIRYRKNHLDRIRENGIKHRQGDKYKNRIETEKPKRRQRDKKRRESDISYRIEINLRCRTKYALKFQNSPRYYTDDEYLGCSPSFLRKYLESQFKEGMSWDNYGFYGWHIDHIRPCDSFILEDPEEQKKCFHYTNLQPLWAKDNLRKSNKILLAA